MYNNMFLNRRCNRAFLLLIVGVGIVLYAAVGCSKPKGDYYKYVNEVHVFKGNSLAFLQSQKGVYDSFLVVLSRLPDVQDSLAQDSVTVLAPINKSFEAAIKNLNVIREIQHKSPLSLATVDSAELDTIVSRYLLRGIIPTEEVAPFVDGIPAYGIKYSVRMNLQYKKNNASGASLSGPQLLYVSDTKTSPYIVHWVRTTTGSVNLYTNNGIVHTLAASHEFGFGEFSTRLNK